MKTWVYLLTLVAIKITRKSKQVFYRLANQPKLKLSDVYPIISVYLRGNLWVSLATQRKSLQKFNLRSLSTTCRSVWPSHDSTVWDSLTTKFSSLGLFFRAQIPYIVDSSLSNEWQKDQAWSIPRLVLLLFCWASKSPEHSHWVCRLLRQTKHISRSFQSSLAELRGHYGLLWFQGIYFRKSQSCKTMCISSVDDVTTSGCQRVVPPFARFSSSESRADILFSRVSFASPSTRVIE